MLRTTDAVEQSDGTMREMVSRLFSQFKKKQLLQLKGATLIIRNRSAPEKMVNF
jgi:CRP-like cAMP-binding protein